VTVDLRDFLRSSLASASDLSKDGSTVLDEGPRTFLYGDQRFLSKRLLPREAGIATWHVLRQPCVLCIVVASLPGGSITSDLDATNNGYG
jgi:hypothetical protein